MAYKAPRGCGRGIGSLWQCGGHKARRGSVWGGHKARRGGVGVELRVGGHKARCGEGAQVGEEAKSSLWDV